MNRRGLKELWLMMISGKVKEKMKKRIHYNIEEVMHLLVDFVQLQEN